MTERAVRAARIGEILDGLYPEVRAPLVHADPFQLLVAVLLSAQTTDARVNLVTPALFARAPDAATMAGLRATEIRTYIKSLGLANTKAKALRGMARALVERFGGQVPRDRAAMETLPGVGHKTAGVVLAQAWDDPAFAVDTHIHRLAGRWRLSRARTVEEVEHDLTRLYPPARWNRLHLQMIYFGREHCPASGHVVAACPICAWAMSKARAVAELRHGSKLEKRPRSRTRARR